MPTVATKPSPDKIPLFVFAIGAIEKRIRERMPEACPMKAREETLDPATPWIVCCWVIYQLETIRNLDPAKDNENSARELMDKIRLWLVRINFASDEELECWLLNDFIRQLLHYQPD